MNRADSLRLVADIYMCNECADDQHKSNGRGL